MKTQFFEMKRILPVVLLVLVMAFTACKKDDNNNVQPDVAGFMAFNLVPDQSAVAVSLSNNMVGVPLPYMNYTGGYVRIYPGTRSTDAVSVNNSNTLATASYTYVPDKYYSLFVIGTDGNYKNVIVNDGLDTVNAADGKVYVRYINAVPGDSAIDIQFANDTATLFSGEAEYGKVSPFMELNAGAVKVSVDGNKADTSRTITFENRKAYTILLAENPEVNNASDSVLIRYIVNGTLTIDSTSVDSPDDTK